MTASDRQIAVLREIAAEDGLFAAFLRLQRIPEVLDRLAAAEQRAQAAESREAALRAALEMAERGTSTRRRQIAPESRPWRLFCEICDMDGPEDGPIDHAPDCPFSALLRAAEGGERDA